MMVEEYLQNDDRCALPLGCTEQHAYLSLSTDSILAERLATEAAEPLGIPVFPVLAYGLTPYFQAYPGTITLRNETYLRVVRDLHGGNTPALSLAGEWMAEHPALLIKFHNWWSAPRVWPQVQAIDPVASHASWMENFPWTRLANVVMPKTTKPQLNVDYLRQLNPTSLRSRLGDGNYGGRYERSDEDLLRIWQAGVEETRELLANWE